MVNKNNKNFEIESYNDVNNGISILDVMYFTAKNIKLILIIPLAFCSLSIVYVQFIATPTFESSAKIMSSSGGGVSQIAGLASEFGISLPRAQSEPKWVYDDIIKSRTLASAMLKREFFSHDFQKKIPLLNIISKKKEVGNINLYELRSKAIQSFINMIHLSQNIKTGIYTLTISTSDPVLSKELVSSIIEELDLHQRNYNKAITSETKKFIEERIVSVKSELELAEEALKDFATSNRRIENSPLLLLEQQRLAREVSVLISVFTTLKQQFETTKIEELKESNYVIVVDPPETPLIRSSPAKKKIVLFAGFLGVSIGFMISLIMHYFMSISKVEKEKLNQTMDLLKNSFYNK